MLRKLLNKVISKIKGEEYEIDKNIPTSYLVVLIFEKVIALWRGFWKKIRFKKSGKHIFIGKKVEIKCPNKIETGNTITIGAYSYIDALSLNGIKLGNNISFGRNTTIECTGIIKELGDELEIGDNVGIAANAFIAVRGHVKIGKDTISGPYLRIHAENHVFSDINTPIRLQGDSRKGVEIGEDCWIGSNVTILDGVKIGNHCVIGAGAVVIKDIPDYAIAGGVPAKIIKMRKDD